MDNKEFQSRIIYTLFRPAIRLADFFRVPMKEIISWVELSYFQEVRNSELTLEEIANYLSVSVSKLSKLSRKLKGNFFINQKHLSLSRRIEFMLWDKPLSQARIEQVLRKDVTEVISKMLEDGRIIEQKGRTTLFINAKTSTSLVSSDFSARLDGLKDQMDSITDMVFGRFLKKDPKTFVRSLTFRIRKSDVPKLEEIYRKHIFKSLEELEQKTIGASDVEEMRLTIGWAPNQYLTKQGAIVDEFKD